MKKVEEGSEDRSTPNTGEGAVSASQAAPPSDLAASSRHWEGKEDLPCRGHVLDVWPV